MRAFSLALIAASLSMANAASADAPTKSERDAARVIAQTGAGYFDNGDWERAREHFHRAYDLIKAPTLALMEARALVKLGKFVEASEVYARAMTINVDETSEPFRKAAADARTESDALLHRVPSIRFTVGAGDSPVEVRLDERVLSKDELQSAVAVDPGTHVIAVTRTDAPQSWETVTVREGEKQIVSIERPSPPLADRMPPSSPSALRPVMWTAFGTGAAGLAVGIVTGALAVDRKAKLDEVCAGQACPVAAESTLDSYRNYKFVSTVGYLVGVAGLATGGVLLAITPAGSSRQTRVGTFVSSTQSGVVVSGGF